VRPALAALESRHWQNVAELYAIGPAPSVDVEWLYNPAGQTEWTIIPDLAGVVCIDFGLIRTCRLANLAL
jgi:hypothetical protein